MSGHLKRHFCPRTWRLLRKENKFITKPLPGGHPLALCVPVVFVLKNLGLANTTRDAKKILNKRIVLIDGKIVTEVKAPVGFMDVLTVKNICSVRVLINSLGNLIFIEVPSNETNKKICRIINKTVLPKGKIQINLSDGLNLISDLKCHVDDSLVLEMPAQKVIDTLKLEKGAFIFLTGGAHIGKSGVIEDIKENKLWFKLDNKRLETLKKFAFVVGKDKPILKLK